jgi:4-amino-4-deoxy-L-arabinose transferase-like glycosyltransferase
MRSRWLAGALLLGLAVRLAFALGYWTGKPLTLDEQEYLLLAHNIATGRGFSYASPVSGRVEGRHVGRAPLYPAFLAAIALGVPGSAIRGDRPPPSVPSEVKVVQAALGCLLIWLIARWTARAVGGGPSGDRAGLVAAGVAAVHPPLVWIGSYALSESLYAVLALAAALAIDRAVHAERNGARWAVAGGVLCGLAALTRPAVLVFLALVLAWLAVRRRPMIAVLVLLFTALIVAPWTVRNRVAYGRTVVIASEGGVTFWTGNNRLATGEGDLAANPAMKEAALALERSHDGASPEELESVFYRAAIDDITDRPLRWAELLARKAFFTVVPIGPSYTLHSPRYVAASLGAYLLLLPFAIAGVLVLRRRTPQPVPLWLLAASSFLVCLVFFPQERFRIPVIDPVLVACAAACVSAGAATGTSGRR